MLTSRYIATESQLTISPLNFLAIDRDKAVFPLAVGPRMTTNSGSRVLGCSNATSAQAPVNLVPVADQSQDQEHDGNHQQASSLGGIDCMPVVPLSGMIFFW